MTYKRIMVPVNGSDDASHALWLAFDLARRCEGEVIGLHATAEAQAALPYMGESLSGSMFDTMLQAMEKEVAARQQAAQAAFDQAQQAAGGIAGQLRIIQGVEDLLLADLGRLADVVVVPRPDSETALSESPTMQAAIMDTGRPVLVAPPRQAASFGRNVLAAWNGSPQAARALTAAMPVLREAETVTLLHIDEGDNEGPSVEEAVAYLAAHGCTAQAVSEPRERPIGETLILAAHNRGADLLVMGAYTHNRLREMIFGGATLEALLDANIPVLMTH